LLITLVLVLFYLPQQKEFWKKVLFATTLVTASIALLLTLSRVAILLWMALLLILLVRDLMKNISKKKWQLLATFGAALISNRS